MFILDVYFLGNLFSFKKKNVYFINILFCLKELEAFDNDIYFKHTYL